MKAEDINNLCPMTGAEKLECIYKPSLNEYRSPWSIFDKTRRLSAEISFKAGIEKGRQQVFKAGGTYCSNCGFSKQVAPYKVILKCEIDKESKLQLHTCDRWKRLLYPDCWVELEEEVKK